MFKYKREIKMNIQLRLKIVEHHRANWKFAQAVGVSEGYVSKVLHGAREPDAESKKHLAKVLKCKPKDIFKDA